jgi:hypothetical protein
MLRETLQGYQYAQSAQKPLTKQIKTADENPNPSLPCLFYTGLLNGCASVFNTHSSKLTTSSSANSK